MASVDLRDRDGTATGRYLGYTLEASQAGIAVYLGTRKLAGGIQSFPAARAFIRGYRRAGNRLAQQAGAPGCSSFDGALVPEPDQELA